MCRHCRDEVRAADVVRTARFLIALGLRAETDPKALNPGTKAWLLAKEEALIADLEPVVSDLGKAYFAEVKASLEHLLATTEPLTQADATALAKAIEATLKKAAEEFASQAAPVVGEHAATAFVDARAGFTADWTLTSAVDKATVAWMKKDPVLWVQEHYANVLTDRVRNMTAAAYERGLGRDELAERLEAVLGPEVEGYRYWDVVASSNITRARSWAVNESMADQGVTTYAWRTAADERVCPTCDALDGTVFSVQKAVDKQRAIVEAEPTPDEYKKMAPWVSTAEGEDGTEFAAGDEDVTDAFDALTPGKDDDGSELQDLGIDGPPVHGRCRCGIEAID